MNINKKTNNDRSVNNNTINNCNNTIIIKSLIRI